MSVLEFLAVYLAPTIPALITFLIIDPAKVNTSFQGTLAGFSVKAGGGVAAYLVFMLLALFFGQKLIQQQQTATLFLQLKGEAAAVREFAKHVDTLAVVMVPTDSERTDLRFERFSSTNGGYTLTSTRDVKTELVGKQFIVTLISDAAGLLTAVSPSLTSVNRTAQLPRPSDDRVALASQTTVTVSVQTKSDEPFDIPIPNTRDWITALSLISNHFLRAQDAELSSSTRQVVDGITAAYDLQYALVFTNETETTLSNIALTDSEPSGTKAKPQLIEAFARRVALNEVRSLWLDLSTDRHLLVRDSSQIVRSVDRIIDSFRTSGSELGYVKVEDGVHKEGARAGALELRANNTTFRVGPLPQGVKPGEAVVVVVRYRYPSYWLSIRAGNQDWFGERNPYPTRVSLITVALDHEELKCDENSVITDFTLPSGQRSPRVPGMELKANDRFLALKTSMQDSGLKKTLLWSWK